MKALFWYALAVAGGFALAACAGLTPEQKQNAIQTLNESLNRGDITQTQYNAAVSALQSGDWGEIKQVGAELLRTGIDVGLALLGVRVWRGSTIARKGAAPTTPPAA